MSAIMAAGLGMTDASSDVQVGGSGCAKYAHKACKHDSVSTEPVVVKDPVLSELDQLIAEQQADAKSARKIKPHRLDKGVREIAISNIPDRTRRFGLSVELVLA